MAEHIYIHIPFCNSICNYCDFPKLKLIDRYVGSYLKALDNEIMTRYQGETVSTIYLGGGTPTSLDLEGLKILFKSIEKIKKSENCEITIEANPDSLDYQKLEFLYQQGVNRLSIGVQTFDEEILKSLNRTHSNKDVFNCISDARKIGFNNINVDLMYGFHGQKDADLQKDLEIFNSLDVEHISIYSLILEENSVFGKNGYNKIDDEVEADYYLLIIEYLNTKGYNHYEISNFSKTNYESIHNNCYWELKDYYGFGFGAHSFINSQRIANTYLIGEYMNGNNNQIIDDISAKNLIEEYMFLGLRKINGVSKSEFETMFSISIESYYKDAIIKLIEKDLLTESPERIKLTNKGLLLANNVMLEFLLD